MTDVQKIVEQIEKVTPDSIRTQIAEREAEIKALSVLLRAKLQRERTLAQFQRVEGKAS